MICGRTHIKGYILQQHCKQISEVICLFNHFFPQYLHTLCSYLALTMRGRWNDITLVISQFSSLSPPDHNARKEEFVFPSLQGNNETRME